MGSFFSNIQVLIGSDNYQETRERVIQVIKLKLAEAGLTEAEEGNRTLVFCDGKGPWLAVYDSDIEIQPEPWEELALLCSSVAPTVAVNVQDSDCLVMCLAAEGETRDFFVSAPEYLDIPQEKFGDYRGLPELWAHWTNLPVDQAKLTQAFGEETLFAEDQLAEIADILGWDAHQCLLGYSYWETDENPPSGKVIKFKG